MNRKTDLYLMLLLLIWFALILGALSGCAMVSVAGPAKPTLTYECHLDDFSCKLVAGAAAISTSEGYPIIETHANGSLVFLPGETPTVFFGNDGLSVNGFPAQDAGIKLPPGIPVLYRHGPLIYSNWMDGSLDVRRGDFVGLIVGEMERGRH